MDVNLTPIRRRAVPVLCSGKRVIVDVHLGVLVLGRGAHAGEDGRRARS
jgi:hypothetical protein